MRVILSHRSKIGGNPSVGTAISLLNLTRRIVDAIKYVFLYVLFQGLSVTEIQEGYELALKKAHEILPGKSPKYSQYYDALV